MLLSLSFFEQQVKEMNREKAVNNTPITFSIYPNEKLYSKYQKPHTILKLMNKTTYVEGVFLKNTAQIR